MNRLSILSISVFMVCPQLTLAGTGEAPERTAIADYGAPLADEILDAQRGGFITESLVIRIGLEQVVSANGETLLVNRLNINDLNRLEGIGVETLIPDQMATSVAGDLLESGGLSFNSQISDRGWLTVIQNRVDDTVIQSLQSLDVELDNVRPGRPVPDFSNHFLQSPIR